jgi:hypothetical protein
MNQVVGLMGSSIAFELLFFLILFCPLILKNIILQFVIDDLFYLFIYLVQN